MPVSEKRSATDGVMVPFKKPRTEVVSYAENPDISVSISTFVFVERSFLFIRLTKYLYFLTMICVIGTAKNI